MNAPLREYDSRAGNLREDKASAMSRNGWRRNLRKFSIRDLVLGRSLNDRAQTRTQNDGRLRFPLAQKLAKVAHAAETGGAEGGFFVATITSGRKPSSRGC